MRKTIDLLRHEPRARLFFAALTQSAVGTGAGYVALLVIAFERFRSPWAISLVLIADLIPAMVLGPVFGAAADRWSRRSCAVAADVTRAVAFAGIAVVPSFEATVALAVLAGAGTGLFTPAALAAVPSLVEGRRVPAATALYGAIADLGYTVGPALAAAILVLGEPETIMAANAVTFGFSALVVARIPFGARPTRPSTGPQDAVSRGLLRDARDGLRATRRMKGVRTVVLASGAALFCAGMFNVGELLLATREIGTSEAGFSILVTMFGLGFVAGSLTGSSGGSAPHLKGRYLFGLLVMAIGLLTSGLAPGFAVAVATFALAGFGNGVTLVYERLLIQTTVPDHLIGRVLGIKDALTAGAFAAAFASAAGILAITGVRTMMVLAAGLGFAVWAASAVALGGVWKRASEGQPSGPADVSPAYR